MNQKRILLLVVLFTILFVYITNIDKIPDEIVLFQNEKYELNYLKGINVFGDTFRKQHKKVACCFRKVSLKTSKNILSSVF